MSRNKLTVIISGASSGIGRAIADHLQGHGHKVYGLSRGEPKKPYAFNYRKLDVTDENSIAPLFEMIGKETGNIDVLINCAGIGVGGPLELTSMEQARKTLDVNVLGAFALIKYALPYLRKSKGIIYNIASVAGPIAIPFQTFYSLSKAALITMSEGLRLELKPLGVRVLSVLPGDTKSEFGARREKIPLDPIYGKRYQKSLEVMERDERNGKDPLSVAKVISRTLYCKHPPVYITVGLSYKLLVFLSRFLPRKITQAIVYMMYGK